jgi:E1A-binding protein p400
MLPIWSKLHIGFFLAYQEDDEATLEADEALITEAERTEEIGALQRESELPMEELLKIYKTKSGI